jgi:hypothetical protein
MKATILNGMHDGDAVTAKVHDALLDLLQGKGWETNPFILHEVDISPCAGCFGCWVRTPGQCVSNDSDDIARSVVQSDLLVYLTPVTFGGYSSELKKAVDHLIFTNLPFFRTVEGETHHRPRYDRAPNLLAIGVLPEHDTESERIFATLVERNAINMFAPAWAAGIITRENANGMLRRELASLLSKVEVGQ